MLWFLSLRNRRFTNAFLSIKSSELFHQLYPANKVNKTQNSKVKICKLRKQRDFQENKKKIVESNLANIRKNYEVEILWKRVLNSSIYDWTISSWGYTTKNGWVLQFLFCTKFDQVKFWRMKEKLTAVLFFGSNFKWSNLSENVLTTCLKLFL